MSYPLALKKPQVASCRLLSHFASDLKIRRNLFPDTKSGKKKQGKVFTLIFIFFKAWQHVSLFGGFARLEMSLPLRWQKVDKKIRWKWNFRSRKHFDAHFVSPAVICLEQQQSNRIINYASESLEKGHHRLTPFLSSPSWPSAAATRHRHVGQSTLHFRA